MKLCPSCQHENADDAHFCVNCQEYIHWEPTRMVQALKPSDVLPRPAAEPAPTAAEPAPPAAAPPPPPPPPIPRVTQAPGLPAVPAPGPAVARPVAPPPPPPAPGGERELALVSLRAPGSETGGAPVAACTPGQQAVLVGMVRNQDRIVHGYQLVVEGLPAEWWTVTPASLDLVPFGSPGGIYEREFELRFHPPRAAEAEARPWPFRLLAVSTVSGEVAGSATGTLEIAPYVEIAAELRPERTSGRRRGDFALALRNRANAPVEIRVDAVDAESACRVRYEQQTFRVEPGHRGGTTFRVRPPRQIWFGRPVERQLQVTATPVGAEAEPARKLAVFRQKAWFPRWILVLIPLIAAAAFAYVKTRPPQVVVPDLVAAWQRVPNKADAGFVIKQVVQDSGLKLGEQTQRPTTAAVAGQILAQSPAPGKKVKKGSAIDVQVAVGTNTAKVPKVVGLSLVDATAVLDKAHLTANPQPAPPNPATATVEKSVPPAGEVAQVGAPVTLFLDPASIAPTTSTDTTGSGTTGTDTGTATTPTTPTTPTTVVPTAGKVATLKGKTLTQATAALVGAGLAPVVQYKYSKAKAGTVTGQNPPADTQLKAGDQVAVVVARPYPPLALSHDGTLVQLDLATGKFAPIVGGKNAAEHPAASADGSLIAFRRGPRAHYGQIWTVRAGRPKSARPVTAAGFDDRRPAISPDGKTIAFVRGPKDGDPANPANDQDLCFVKASATRGQPSCAADPANTVDRPTWAPDGKAILVVSRRLVPAGAAAPAAADAWKFQQWNLAEYVTDKPSSALQSNWRRIGVVTSRFHGQQPSDTVFQAAWSPSGAQVAFVAYWAPSQVTHLFLADVVGDRLKKVHSKGRVPGCQLAWRPDGGELAITQADATCSGVPTQSRVVSVDPARPSATTTLTPAGYADPAWPILPPAK